MPEHYLRGRFHWRFCSAPEFDHYPRFGCIQDGCGEFDAATVKQGEGCAGLHAQDLMYMPGSRFAKLNSAVIWQWLV